MGFTSMQDRRILNDGNSIPCLGYGTFQSPDGEDTSRAVREAIELGYRHIDCAAVYGNEKSVGRGIAQSGIQRSQLFVTSKVWNDHHGYRETREACEKTLEDMGLDYLDLYLIHWPNPLALRSCWAEKNAETWQAMEEMQAQGLIRSLGISNFRLHHYEALMKTARVKPVVNQIKLCPGITQPTVAAFCQAEDILLEGYSPLGQGDVLETPFLIELGRKYDKTPAQIALRWGLERGYIPLPKSIHRERMAQNAQIFDFSLTEEEVATLAGLKEAGGIVKDPDTVSF